VTQKPLKLQWLKYFVTWQPQRQSCVGWTMNQEGRVILQREQVCD
jgi:hypothetical protein